MATKPLEAYINSLKESQARLAEVQGEWVKEARTIRRAHLKKQMEQWTRKCLYLTEQLINYGTSSSIVQVSGKAWVNDRKSGFAQQKEFSIYFTGLTVNDARVYFENIVKTKWENIILETISFKSIPVGVIQINYVKL